MNFKYALMILAAVMAFSLPSSAALIAPGTLDLTHAPTDILSASTTNVKCLDIKSRNTCFASFLNTETLVTSLFFVQDWMTVCLVFTMTDPAASGAGSVQVIEYYAGSAVTTASKQHALINAAAPDCMVFARGSYALRVTGAGVGELPSAIVQGYEFDPTTPREN